MRLHYGILGTLTKVDNERGQYLGTFYPALWEMEEGRIVMSKPDNGDPIGTVSVFDSGGSVASLDM